MILAPQEVRPDWTDQDIKQYVTELAAKHNVVVIVPSASRAGWKTSSVNSAIPSQLRGLVGRDPPQARRPGARDEVTRAVTFILDANVAEAAVHAITADAMAREARIRQARQQVLDLSQGSYGSQNREAIAARETTIADGLRAIERAYSQAVEPAPAVGVKSSETRGSVGS
jgi:hypothetical protein